ncbi:hypothetical protein T10_1423 [Trichinella papuae]|uniref:Retroviral polymerase SH3-like domain-containing protein n=1 Tax=Trichinella papuae TaxID=268474 RepID=A0A0V1M5X3_9BILA|nr:hypothetical protein T10_1423 [Trichinella papuae]
MKGHWAEAEHAAAYFVNRVGKEIQTSILPSDAYKHAPKQYQKEFNKKSRKDIFVGYPSSYKIFRVFEPRKCRTDEMTDEEIRSVHENSTQSVAYVPSVQKIILCKLVFKTKVISDRVRSEYKAGLAVTRFIQRRKINYLKTFSPVAGKKDQPIQFDHHPYYDGGSRRRWAQPDHCIQVNAPGAESHIIMRLYAEDGLLCCSDLTDLKDHVKKLNN